MTKPRRTVESLASVCRSAEETIVPEEAVIKGQLPDWLEGTFLATGPAKWDFNGFTLNHWLDGCCMVSKISIGDQNASLEKKFLRTDYYNGLNKTGKPIVMSFGTRAFPDDKKSLIARFISNYIMLDQSDNCSGITNFGSDFVTSGETCFSHQLDIETLNLKGCKTDTTKSMGLLNLLCHGHRDSEGNYFNIGGTVTAGGCKTNVVKISEANQHPNNTKLKTQSQPLTCKKLSSSASGNTDHNVRIKEMMKKSEIIASWPNRNTTAIPYGHSFGMTENYLIYIDQPYYMSLLGLMSSTVKGQSFKDLFKWHPEERNRFIIVEKKSGNLLPVEIFSEKPFFFSHFINSYEENNSIIVDIMAATDPSCMDATNLSKLRNKPPENYSPNRPTRFVLPLPLEKSENKNKKMSEFSENKKSSSSGSHHDNNCNNNNDSNIVSGEVLSSYQGMEGVTLNSNFIGKKYSIFYGSQSFHPDFLNRLGKFNLKTGQAQIWEGRAFEHAGVPTFVRKPDCHLIAETENEEDEGVIISAVTSAKDEYPSFLLVLDAKTFVEIARVEFTSQIPMHMHSYFVSKTV